MEMLEFTPPVLNIRAVLPQIILTVTALTVLMADVFSREKGRPRIGYLTLAGVVLAGIGVLPALGARESAYSGMLAVDGFAAFITVTVCIILVLTVLVSINYQRFFTGMNCGEYYCLLLFAGVGMTFMGAAGHLLMLFVALETMSIAVYVLAGFHRREARSIESALKYFLLGAFASGFLLYGFALIYGAAGTMNIAGIAAFLEAHPEARRTPLLMGGVALSTVGFGFKIAMVPFHMWTPDVYEGAPTSVTAFMATGVKAAAFAAFIRVFFGGLGLLQQDWTAIMWLAAFVTMTLGNVAALAQTNIKRMLAYSSIAHAGYLLVGFVAGSAMALAGILFYLLSYALMNVGAFGVIALLGRREGEYTELSDYRGLGAKYPFMGFAMAVFMFSMAGIPPTAGFMSKFYIFTAAISEGFIWLAVLGIINSIISIFYYLRVTVIMYFQDTDRPLIVPGPSPAVIVGLTLACLGVLWIGIFPSWFWLAAQRSVF